MNYYIRYKTERLSLVLSLMSDYILGYNRNITTDDNIKRLLDYYKGKSLYNVVEHINKISISKEITNETKGYIEIYLKEISKYKKDITLEICIKKLETFLELIR